VVSIVIGFALGALGAAGGILTGAGDSDGFQITANFGGSIVSVVLVAAYDIVLIARGQTLGMMVMKTYVIREGSGETPDLGTSALRWLVPKGATQIVSLIPFIGLIAIIGIPIALVDVLWMLWDPKNQTLHDKVAKTLVVRRAS
jgi:uncharacterized RDD family membrane protein YckC